jgi:hypothetical protein
MDYPNNTTNSRKQKHLNFEERVTVQLRLKDGNTPYRIAKELGHFINTITNKIRCDIGPQISKTKGRGILLTPVRRFTKNILKAVAHNSNGFPAINLSSMSVNR